MNKQLKGMFPTWINEVSSDNKLILTNDLDSLFSCAILEKLFGCEIGMFYDFKALHSTQSEFDQDKVIGVDLALEDKDLKTYCNHVTRMAKDDKVNPNSANLNNIAGIHGGTDTLNYFGKYAGSTALMILSLYDAFDMLLLEGETELTLKQKQILVGIDSYYYGAYLPESHGGHLPFYKWKSALGLELFDDVYNTYTRSQLSGTQSQYSLKAPIQIGNRNKKIQTEIDIWALEMYFPMLNFDVPQKFDKAYPFKATNDMRFRSGTSKIELGSVFSLSVTRRDQVKYTIL